jgi:chromosomal replication initiation ATPase DnaA
MNNRELNRLRYVMFKRYGYSVDVLLGPDRKRSLSRVRHIGMWVARHLGASYPETASAFGRKDHTTAMSAVRRVESDQSLLLEATDLLKEVRV